MFRRWTSRCVSVMRFATDHLGDGPRGLLAHGGKDLIGPFLVITNIYLPHAHVYTQMCVYIYMYILTNLCACAKVI